MPALKTMFQLTGRGYAAATLNNASLLIIDAQNEYLEGPLALSGMPAATANIALLLEAAQFDRIVKGVAPLGSARPWPALTALMLKACRQ